MSRRTRRTRRASSRGEPSAGSSANEQDEEEEDDNSGAEANAESTSEKETAAPSTRRSKRTRKPTARSVIAAASTHVRKRKPPGEAKSKEEENSMSGDDRDSEEDPSKEPQNSKSSKQSESGDSSGESEKEVQDDAAKKRRRASKGSLRRKASSKLEKDSKDGDSSDDESDDEPLTKLRVSKRSTPNKQSRKGGSKSGDALEGSEKESKTADASEEADGSDDEPLTNLKSTKRTTRKTRTKKSASNSGAANPDGSEKASNTVYNLDEDNSDDEPLTKLRAALESKRKGRSKPSEPKADESEKVGSSDEDDEDNEEPLTKSKSGGSPDEGGESDKSPLEKPHLSKRSAQKLWTKKEREESPEKDDDDLGSADEPDDKEPLTRSKSGDSSDQGDKADQGDKSDEKPPKKPRASKLSARTRQTKKGRQESTEADNGSDDDQGSDDVPPKKVCASKRTALKRSKGSEIAGGDSSDEGKESAHEQESAGDAVEKPKDSEQGKTAKLGAEVKKDKVDSSKEQESFVEGDGSGEDEEDPPRDQRKSSKRSGSKPRNKGKSHEPPNGQENEEIRSKIFWSPKRSQQKKASKNSDSKDDESDDQDKGSDSDRENEVSSNKNQKGSRSSPRKIPVEGSASGSDESSDVDNESKAEKESEKDHEDKSHSSAENAVAKDDEKPEVTVASDLQQESDDEPLGALRSSRRLTQKMASKKGESSDDQHSEKGDNSGNELDSDDASSKGKRATNRSPTRQKKVDPTGGDSSEGGDKSADEGRGSRRSTRRSKRRRLNQENISGDEAASGDNDFLPSNREGEESENNRGAGEQRSTEKLDTIESSDNACGTDEAEEKTAQTSRPPQEAPEKNEEISPSPKDAPGEDEEVTGEKIILSVVEGFDNSMREEDSDKDESNSGVANESQAGNILTSTMEMDDAVADGDNPPEKTDNVEEKTDPDNSKIGKDETEDATPQSREQFSTNHDRDSEAGLPAKPTEVDADTKHASEGPNEVTSIDAERPADETGVDVEFWNSSDADEAAVLEQDERPVDSSIKRDEIDMTDLKSEAQLSSNMDDDEPASRDQEVADASEPVPENKDSEIVESKEAPAVDVESFKTRVGDPDRQVMEASIEEDPIPDATEEPIETDHEGPEREDRSIFPVASQSDSIVDGPGIRPLEVTQSGESQAEAKVDTISTEVEVPRDKEPSAMSPDDIVDVERDAEMKPKDEIGTDAPLKALGADLCKDASHSPQQADAEDREEKPGNLANATLPRDGTVTGGLKNLPVSSADDIKDESTPPTPVESKEEGRAVYVAKQQEEERSLQENGTGNAAVERNEGEKEKAPNATSEREDLQAIDSSNEEQVDATTSYKSESAAIELENSKEEDKDLSPETKGGSPAGEDVVKVSGVRASHAEGSTPLFKQDHVRNIGNDTKEFVETRHDGDETQGEVAEKSGERSGDTDNAVASPASPDIVVLVSSNVGSPQNLIERNSQGETENEQSNIQDQEGLSENTLPGEEPVMEKAEQRAPQHLPSVQLEASAENDGDTTPATPVREIHEKSGNHFMEVFSSPIRQEDIERSQGTSEEKRTGPKLTGPALSVHNSTLVEESDGDNEQFHDAQMELSSEPPSPQVPVNSTKGGPSTQDYSPTALAISKLPLVVIHEESHQFDKAIIPGLHQKTFAEDVVEKLSPKDPKAEQEKPLPAALSLDIGGAQEPERGTNVEILQTKIELALEAAAAAPGKDQEEERNRKRSQEEVESTAPQEHGPPGLGQDAGRGPDLRWARACEEEKAVILPGLGGRAEEKELAGIVGGTEALKVEDKHAELPLDTREEDESTIGQVPYEGLDREKLDRIKAVLYSEGNRVHRGHGFERIFADYWNALSLRLSERLSSHASEQCRVAVKTFLKTRKLRRLHNKFLIGLMGRATRQTAPLREVSQHIPVKWRDRIKRCKSERRQRLHAAKDPDQSTTGLKARAEVTPFYREAWAAEGSFARFTPLAAREEVKNDVQEVLAETPSSSIPGALVIDPLVRDIVQEDGMRVTENAIWLLVVAVKEHTKATLKRALDVKEASQNGHVLPRTKNYAHTLASTSKALTSGKASPAKPAATWAVASKKRKWITSLDICAASTSSHLAGIGSLGGSLSRYAFERCLHSAYDASPMIPEPNFVQVHHFITSEIASAVKKIKLMPIKEVVQGQRPAVSTPTPPERPFIQSKPPPASVPPAHFAPPIAAPVAAVTHAPVPSQPATSRPVAENEPKPAAGVFVPRGLGRGAKNLAALKMRAATDTPPLPKGDELPLPVAPMAPDASSKITATQSQVSPIPTTNTPAPLVSTKQDPSNTPNIIKITPEITTAVPVPVPIPVPVPVPVPAPTLEESVPANAPSETKPDITSTSEPAASKALEPIRPVMQRRGKGFGTKNLAAMRMRSIQRVDTPVDGSDKTDEEQAPEPENGETGNTDESSKAQESDPKPPEDNNASLLAKPESKDNPIEKVTGNAGGNPQNQTTISQQT